ncbi:uncharacterized protein [Dendropsophus ebraccatus]|uniref:uncharacterized protein n=1 Tax=Dendropsophus ebraccatus TaxID=150705 RepID=UPI0038315CC4
MEEAHYLEYELQTAVKQQLKCLKEELEELSECSQSDQECVVEKKICVTHLQEKQAAVEQAHRKQISEEHLKLQDQLERGELNGLMKQKLIREHGETIAYLEKTLQQDLEKRNLKLEGERLPEVTHDHPNMDTGAPAGKTNVQNNDHKILSLLTDYINIFHQTEQIAAARITLLGPCLYSSMLPSAGDSCKLLESSPMLNLLKEVDSQLRASAQSAKLLQSDNNLGIKKWKTCFLDALETLTSSFFSYRPAGKEVTWASVGFERCCRTEMKPHHGTPIINSLENSFWDVKDLLSNCKGDLSPIEPEALSARELAIYEYGKYILQLLKLHINIGDLNLHVTSCLPSNSYKGNAFSHSFFYQGTENNLFVSREYLQSVGSFILLVVHCTCHIAVGDFNDDSNPLFRRTLYQALQVCFTEGFLARLQFPSSHSQCIKSEYVNGSKPQEAKLFSQEKLDLLSTLISQKSDTSTFYKPLKNLEKNGCQNEVEAILKNKLTPWKLHFFTNHDPQICDPDEEDYEGRITAEYLQEQLDQLNAELALILKKEADINRNMLDADGQCYHLQMILAEKECLKNRIVKIENKIQLLSSMV